MEDELLICYDNEGKIKIITPKDLKPDDHIVTCIPIKKVIIDDHTEKV